MSVALSAISSFGTFLVFFPNTVPTLKSLIVIILVVNELNFVVCGSTEFWAFSCSPNAQSLTAIGFHGTSFLSSIFFWNLLIGFYFVNLVVDDKMQ